MSDNRNPPEDAGKEKLDKRRKSSLILPDASGYLQ